MASYHPTLEAAIRNNIVALREKKYPGRGGQAACAKALGINVQQWNGIERGTRVPDPANLDRIANGLGVDVSALWQNTAPAAQSAEASRAPLVPTVIPELLKPPEGCPNQKACLSQAKLLKLLAGIAGMSSWPQEARDVFVDELLEMMERALKQPRESETGSEPAASAL